MGIRRRFIKRYKKDRDEKVVTVDLGYENAYRIETPPDCGVSVGKLQGIGKREKQQDSFGVSELKEEVIEDKGILAVVADGMGGLSDGEKASMTTVISCLHYYDTNEDWRAEKMVSMAQNANNDVKEVLGESNAMTGSTLAAVHIRNRELFWLSVGDSHIYLCREEELIQMNADHNYAADLWEQVEKGEITEEEARNDPQKNALTSYIGIGRLEKIDYNAESVVLLAGDRILLVSDGVYNTLTQEEIMGAMRNPLGKSMMNLEIQIERKRKGKQDNYTALVIEITD